MNSMENQFIVFKLFNQFCVLGLDKVVEVANVTALVKTKAKELNVMTWRNRSIPIIDPTAMMSKVDKHIELTTKTKILVVKVEDGLKEIGIMVDAVIGVEEIEKDEIIEASINDARYIIGRVTKKNYQLKMLDMKEFLKEHVVEKFPIIYDMRTEELEQGVKIMGKVPEGKEEVVESMRLKAINWLIRAIKRNIEEPFVMDMKKIYDLTLKL
ncbi:hypothetical protein CN918_27520 [Priestia megaterium]|nr:hypothetical protein CN918_27520 [Priestia megaterium]